MDFKIGDTVERIRDNYMGMHPGDKDEVVDISEYNSIALKKFGTGHGSGSLKLISRKVKNWKARIEGSD